ncbi:MAG TPA: hypothetical protein VHK86_00820 [Nitrososphaera sp.]|jgi:hypothetical protein|nr:hypothetical protein [Nitrososphaera sp.]
MDRVQQVLAILVVMLFLGVVLLFVQLSSTKSQVSHAKDTNALTLQLLRVQGVGCSATAQDFQATGKCLENALVQKDFKEDGFSQPAKGDPGYLIIKNINRRSYDSSSFTFLFNREIVEKGCNIPGNIDYNVDCRFDFDQYCEKGSVLEVNYTMAAQDGKQISTKIFTKNC